MYLCGAICQDLPVMDNFTENHPLKPYNSFGVEATARYFAEFSSADDLRKIFEKYPPDRKWMVLGGGNNVLFGNDYDGLIVHPVADGIEVVAEDTSSVTVRAQAALEWDDLVKWSVEHGLGGLENLTGIPGYAGAAPVQNIGAYGTEAADTIVSVEVYDVASGAVNIIKPEECRFGYRESIFKRELKGKVIILAVDFRLAKQPAFNIGYGDLAARVEELGGPSLGNVRAAVKSIRDTKLPDPKVKGNAGSFFKNPVVSADKAGELKGKYPGMPCYDCEGGVKIPAGWLVEQSGWKGRALGSAGVHDRQALVLVNHGGATGKEIMTLARAIQDDVFGIFAVEIETEVNYL